jgi:hypothetical protein
VIDENIDHVSLSSELFALLHDPIARAALKDNLLDHWFPFKRRELEAAMDQEKQPLDEKQVGNLLDHFEGIRNASGPERVLDAVNPITNIASKHERGIVYMMWSVRQQDFFSSLRFPRDCEIRKGGNAVTENGDDHREFGSKKAKLRNVS